MFSKIRLQVENTTHGNDYVDGALDKRNGIGGVGVIIRDHDGFVLAVKVKHIPHALDSFVVEALSIFLQSNLLLNWALRKYKWRVMHYQLLI